MSNSAWYDLNSRGDIRKVHDMCPNAKCKCQKQITFTPKHFQLEIAGFRQKLKQKIFTDTQTTSNKFLKPALNIESPYINLAVSAITKNPKIGEATSNILKSISGLKILSLTDMHGHRLRLKVM